MIKNPMHLWFMYLFEQRMDKNHFVRCYECNKKMSEASWKENSACYSHILSKKTFPQYKGNPDNVMIVHNFCHNLYTMNPKAAVNQFNLYLELLDKHYKNEL